MTTVFVYGTLTDPARAESLLDRFRFVGDAVLLGLHRVDGAYPTLAPGGRVDGRLLRTPEIDRLDAYEGADRDLYVRVSVPIDAASADLGAAAVYVGDPAQLDVEPPVDWPGDGPFRTRVEGYLRDEGVSVRVRDDRSQNSG